MLDLDYVFNCFDLDFTVCFYINQPRENSVTAIYDRFKAFLFLTEFGLGLVNQEQYSKQTSFMQKSKIYVAVFFYFF